MAKFKWHKMGDKYPQDFDAQYLLLGENGMLYISALESHGDYYLFRSYYNHYCYINSEKIKAWAKIPEYREVK